MIVYEVNIALDREIVTEYGSWLPDHINEILKISGFISADWFERDSNASDDPQKIFWTIQYKLRNRSVLENYLKNHAPKMRKAATDLFGARFLAERRILELRNSYKGEQE